MPEPKYYVYKCIVDDGGAPCVDENLLTLTICKPAIRRTANEGDWIVGIGSNTDDQVPNRLVYMAHVDKRLSGGVYFKEPEYQDRPDCIYEWNGDKLEWKDGAVFHKEPQARKSDIGERPPYENANALISSDFRYFGGLGTNDWKLRAPELMKVVEALQQGHRLNHSEAVYHEISELRKWLWESHPNRKKIGEPLHARRRHCATDEGDDGEKDFCTVRCNP